MIVKGLRARLSDAHLLPRCTSRLGILRVSVKYQFALFLVIIWL